MGRQRLALLFSSLLFCSPVALTAGDTGHAPDQWTVQSATRYALANNPDAKTALERIKAADADIRMAKAAFYPHVGLSTEYSRTNNPMYSFGNILNQGMFTDTIDFNNPGTTDTLQTKATIQYRLYNGGHDTAALDAADERGRAAGYEQAALHGRLEFEVVRAFWTIVQSEESVRARRSALDALSSSLAVAKARFSEGSLLKEELLNLEVQQSRAQEQHIQAQHGLQLALRGFLHLLGLSGNSVAIDSTTGTEQEIPVERDIRNRAELAGMTATIKAFEAQVRQAKSGFLPSADAFGSLQADKGTQLSEGSGTSWAAGVRINYTLFNGQQASAATELAEARVREAKERLRKMELSLNLEMEQAQIALRQEEERLKVTAKMVASASESARLARLRFKEGLLLASELINTENRLTDARMSHAIAGASRKIAIADLRRTVGLPQFN